jgi:hypothetical protein
VQHHRRDRDRRQSRELEDFIDLCDRKRVKLAAVGGDTDLSTDHGVFNNRAGRDDPKAMDKFEHGEKVIEAQKRIAVPRRQLLHYGQVDGR